MEMTKQEIIKADVVASFQKAVVEVLADNALKACNIKGTKRIAIAGGVSANSALRKYMISEGEKKGIEVLFPSIILCTDNAAMIGSAAYFEFLKGRRAPLDLNAIPNLKLGER